MRRVAGAVIFLTAWWFAGCFSSPSPAPPVKKIVTYNVAEHGNVDGTAIVGGTATIIFHHEAAYAARTFRLLDIDGIEIPPEVNTDRIPVEVPAGRALDISLYVVYHSDKPGYRRLGVFRCPPLERGKTYKVWYEKWYKAGFTTQYDYTGAGRLVLTYSDVDKLEYEGGLFAESAFDKRKPEYNQIYVQDIPPLTTGIPGWQRPVAASTQAAPGGAALWTGNGHQYQIVEQDMTWDEANAYAKKEGGYMATVTSTEEQAFIEELIKKEDKKLNFWLGGYREGKKWVWVTGELWKYTNWMKKRPDRDRLYKSIVLRSVQPAYQRQEGSRDFQWDNANPKWKCGLIIEWDQ